MPSGGVEIVQALPSLAARAVDSNKGAYGRVLVVAGSRGMSGAAVLCGLATLRGGAGLVRLAVPEGILPIVASSNPCYMTAALKQDDEGRLAEGALDQVLSLAEHNDVLALGPGLGQSDAVGKVVSGILERVRIPVVLDADGLNAIQNRVDLLRRRPGPTILTPHPGEFARLTQSTVSDIQAQRRESATRFAAEHGVIVVLKGHGSIITDGRRLYQNNTGNPGMATGGTGDVLTGLIAALVGQKLEVFAAAQLGVHIHGLAGDLAREHLGEPCMIATDLLDFLPKAFRNL